MTTTPNRHLTRDVRLFLYAGGVAVATSLIAYSIVSGPQRFSARGAGYPGAITSGAELLVQFGATLAGAFCLGALVFILITTVPDDSGRIDPAAFRVHLLAERIAPWWAMSSVIMIAVSAAAGAGVPVGRLVRSPAIGDAIAASESARGWCVAALFAGTVAVGVRFTLRWIGHVVLVAPAAVAVIAVAVTGSAGQGPDHDVATSAAIVFALAIAVLTGVKIAAAVSPPELAARGRVVLLGAVAGAVAAVYGAILVTLMAAGSALLGTDYGRLAVGAGVLVVAVWLGDLAQVFRPHGQRLWADYGSAVAMIAVIGALSVTVVLAPPRFLVHEFTRWDVFLGYQLPGPPTVLNLVTVWRFDPLIGTAALVAAFVYLRAALRLRRRGDRWPLGRTVAWTTGCAALLVASSSGVRAYGSAMFSVHMAEHMSLNMFVPVLLVLGAPVTLALRVLPPARDTRPPGPREWLLWLIHSRVTAYLSHPVTAFVLFVGSLYLVYFTPLFATLVRYHWGHELMSVHFLVTGYLFFWGIIGIDPGPKRLPFLGRLGLLFAVMPFHAFFGVATMTMTSTLGGDFYYNVGLPWLASIADDQRVGGAIAWSSGELPVLIVVVALVAQWARQDRRAGARKDRHIDSGYDHDLDAYNAMLRELARNRR